MPGHYKRREVFSDLILDNRVTKYISKNSNLKKLDVNNNFLEIDDLKVKRRDAFKSKFHICIENCEENSYFTEKIMDCFITKTIPIYWGCLNIEKYFNKNGIILINNFNNIIEIINYIEHLDYQDKISIIEENYLKALNYRSFSKRLTAKLEELF